MLLELVFASTYLTLEGSPENPRVYHCRLTQLQLRVNKQKSRAGKPRPLKPRPLKPRPLRQETPYRQPLLGHEMTETRFRFRDDVR